MNEILKIACESGSVEIVKLALANPRIDPTVENNLALDIACICGHVELVKLFLADPRINPEGAIQRACGFSQQHVVRLLLTDSRVNPADEDGVVFTWACERGHLDIVKTLLADPRIDPTMNQNAALTIAVYNYPELVKLLLTNPRVDPTFNNNDPIILASEIGFVEMVKVLLADHRVVAKGLENAIRVTEDSEIIELLQHAQYGIGGEKYNEMEQKLKNC